MFLTEGTLFVFPATLCVIFEHVGIAVVFDGIGAWLLLH